MDGASDTSCNKKENNEAGSEDNSKTEKRQAGTDEKTSREFCTSHFLYWMAPYPGIVLQSSKSEVLAPDRLQRSANVAFFTYLLISHPVAYLHGKWC